MNADWERNPGLHQGTIRIHVQKKTSNIKISARLTLNLSRFELGTSRIYTFRLGAYSHTSIMIQQQLDDTESNVDKLCVTRDLCVCVYSCNVCMLASVEETYLWEKFEIRY